MTKIRYYCTVYRVGELRGGEQASDREKSWAWSWVLCLYGDLGSLAHLPRRARVRLFPFLPEMYTVPKWCPPDGRVGKLE